MSRIHSRSDKRAAFTLVELMVVVLIIAILVSLVSSAVVMAMGKIPETQTRTEITEMESALRAFMSDFNLTDPPPSSLTLLPNPSNYAAGDPNFAFLTKVFGRSLGTQGPINWGGTNGGGILNAEQCLVFYLGGINNQGFSYNNANPQPIPGQRTKGPYFTFQTSRLVVDPTNIIAPGFPVYIDPWQTKSGPYYATLGGSPYAYFSSYGINNNYATTADSYGALPYFIIGTSNPVQFTNPNTYQIISAGKNGVFGSSGWTPAGGVPIGQPGADDQANFSSKVLGVGQQ
jgi:prepilin-type N-terminal cleavage/methylation domain-containing protein